MDAPRPPLELIDLIGTDPLHGALFEGVPPHLLSRLRSWLSEYLIAQPGLAERVALQLRLVVDPTSNPPAHLISTDGTDLLVAVSTALQLDDSLSIELATEGYVEDPSYEAAAAGYDIPAWLSNGLSWTNNCTRGPRVDQLDQILDDAGSAYTVRWGIPTRLIRRVDPTVLAAAKEAIAADPTAGKLLADAWLKVYGLEPDRDPDGAYSRAVRAVEQLACPLVLNASAAAGKATLGRVVGNLDGTLGPRWKFVLSSKDDIDDVGPIAAVMRRLWEGQKSRHGGGSNSRPQTLEEARAAVHLAVYLVDALHSGALAPRT